MWLFYYFYFERNYDVLKSKSLYFLLNKNINFNESKMDSKMENPTYSFREMNLCFSSYKNCELKIKLWWVGACERKKSVFFVMFILSKGNIFNICVLSPCIVYRITFENIYTFTYQKTLLHTLLLLFFKIVESLQCILKYKRNSKVCESIKFGKGLFSTSCYSYWNNGIFFLTKELVCVWIYQINLTQ